MLNLDLESFDVAFEGGSVKNVGPTDKAATAKLFHPETVEAREFGDSQVKIVAEDADGNEVQVALSPEQAEAIETDVRSLRENSQVFE